MHIHKYLVVSGASCMNFLTGISQFLSEQILHLGMDVFKLTFYFKFTPGYSIQKRTQLPLNGFPLLL